MSQGFSRSGHSGGKLQSPPCSVVPARRTPGSSSVGRAQEDREAKPTRRGSGAGRGVGGWQPARPGWQEEALAPSPWAAHHPRDSPAADPAAPAAPVLPCATPRPNRPGLWVRASDPAGRLQPRAAETHQSAAQPPSPEPGAGFRVPLPAPRPCDSTSFYPPAVSRPALPWGLNAARPPEAPSLGLCLRPLGQESSKWGPGTSNISIPRELVRNVNSGANPDLTESEFLTPARGVPQGCATGPQETVATAEVSEYLLWSTDKALSSSA